MTVGISQSLTGIKDRTNDREVSVIQRPDGKNAIAIDGTVQIEQLFGQDNIADSWFYIGTAEDACDGVGAENDTVRVQIAAGCDPALYPAVDVTTTVTAAILADPRPAKALSKAIVDNLNVDANFKMSWDASTVGENGMVHISALEELYGEVGERLALNSLTVTTVGTTTVNVAFNEIARRGKSTSLARDPRDPRVGTLGVSGSIRIRADKVSQIHQERAQRSGGGENLAELAGSLATPVTYTISAYPDGQPNKIIESIKLYGTDTNIKVGESNFLGENSSLTNGILIKITKEGVTTELPVLKTTNDILARFSTSASNNKIISQSGGDYFEASFNLVERNLSLELEAGTTDKIEILIRDAMAGIPSMYAVVDGFLE